MQKHLQLEAPTNYMAQNCHVVQAARDTLVAFRFLVWTCGSICFAVALHRHCCLFAHKLHLYKHYMLEVLFIPSVVCRLAKLYIKVPMPPSLQNQAEMQTAITISNAAIAYNVIPLLLGKPCNMQCHLFTSMDSHGMKGRTTRQSLHAYSKPKTQKQEGKSKSFFHDDGRKRQHKAITLMQNQCWRTWCGGSWPCCLLTPGMGTSDPMCACLTLAGEGH